jgi:hypothetical protein
MKWQAWAFVGQTVVCAADDWNSPEEVWKDSLGWPDEQEIETAKKRGCRVVRVTIEEAEE